MCHYITHPAPPHTLYETRPPYIVPPPHPLSLARALGRVARPLRRALELRGACRSRGLPLLHPRLLVVRHLQPMRVVDVEGARPTIRPTKHERVAHPVALAALLDGRQWTAGWALAGEPRSRRRDTPAATVRGAASTYWHPARLAAAHRRRPQVRRWLTRERRQRWSDRRLCGASASARAPKKGGWTERAALGHRTALEWLQIMVSGIYDCQSTVG